MSTTEEQDLQAAQIDDANAIEQHLQAVENPEPEPEPIPEPTPEPTPVAPEPPAPTPSRVQTEAEIEEELKQYQPPKNAHENVVKGFDALKHSIKEKSKQVRDLEDAIKQKEEQGKSVKVLTPELESKLEALQRERDELHKAVRIKDAEGYVKRQYQPAIQQIESEAVNLLKQWGTSEEVAKFLTDNGGVSEIMFSTSLMPDGRTTQEEWFKSQILDAMSPRQRFEFDARLRTLAEKRADQSRAIQSAQQDTDRVELEQKQLQEQGRTAWMERLTKAKADIMKQVGPGANRMEIASTDTPEQKAAKEEHNNWLDESDKFFDNAIKATEPEQVAQIGVMAASANYMGHVIEKQNAQIAKQAEQIKAQEAKLAAITKARSTARPSSSAPPASNKTTFTPTTKLPTDSDAVESLLREIESK